LEPPPNGCGEQPFPRFLKIQTTVTRNVYREFRHTRERARQRRIVHYIVVARECFFPNFPLLIPLRVSVVPAPELEDCGEGDRPWEKKIKN